jgi:hypothetical protein
MATNEAMLATTATLYEPGDIIAGKYQIDSLLGQGGMGAVFCAKNLALDAPVAIKVVRNVGDIPVLHERLLQEARAAAKLSHPNIVKVFDVGETASGEPFIVMELLLGQSLGAILRTEQRLPATQAVRLLLPIADALWMAHGKGIVHRDLKPDNVFLVEQDSGIEPKLLDFGIVKLDAAHGSSHLTQGGAAVGSPDYMSPEQARGQDDINLLTDVWSFCVLLYETIAGQMPFSGGNYNALMRQILEHSPPSLFELAAADSELSAIVQRGLSKQAGERFASMGELGRALARWLLGQGVTEDISGATLEARWLRGDLHVRGGRASLASISDLWPVEGGSGVRPNAVGAGNTIPAPAPAASRSADAAAQGSARPPRRHRSLVLWSLALLAAAGLVALVASSRSPGTQPAPRPAPVPVAPNLAEASSAPVVSSAPPLLAEQPAAPSQPRGELSSRPGRATGAAPQRAPRPASAKSASPRPKPVAKPDDLLSPYQ